MSLSSQVGLLATAVGNYLRDSVLPRLLPSGGASGTVLKKSSATNYAVAWGTLAKGDVGLGNVDNTSDANKPVSTATQTALNGKASTSHTHAISDVTNLQTNLDLALKESFVIALSDLTTPIETGTEVNYIDAPYNLVITEVITSLLTASTSGLVIVDVNKAGSSIFGTRPSIDANETSSTTGTASGITGTTTTWNKGQRLTFDIDSAGAGAKGLQVMIVCTKA